MILVTGATGFIGRRLIGQLSKLKDKEEIICLVHEKSDSKLEKTGRDIIKKYGLPFIPVDLLTGSGLDKAPKSPKVIFHLAAITDTAVKDHRINDVGTKNLLEAIGPLNKNTHFVYTSSIAINDNRQDYSVPVNESTLAPKRPCNEYGRKKLLTEQYLIQKSKEQGFSLSIVRVSCVYGEGSKKDGLFDGTKKMVLKGSMLTRLNWPGKMSLINVDDMANLLIQVSRLKPKPGNYEIYIPSIEVLTLADMSKIIHGAYGLKYKSINLPSWFWNFCCFLAKRKYIVEAMLPHKQYNKFWQACILVNNEYWNTSKKINKFFTTRKPTKFRDYYRKIANRH
ncbi:MAG: NAD(P)-dependent oxidoreductase [Nanoarchaeota archaeon]|nr:NAD(P)-dependent oxidoreductase [Nanoarchaeota archaeon]